LKQGKLLILGRKVNSHRGLGVIRRVIIALLGSAFLLSSASATTYRWTGDDGQVIYSQVPPADGRPHTIIGPPPPPADAAREQSRLDALRQGFADRQEDKQLGADEQAKEAEKQAAVAKNCDTARRNIAALEGSPNRLIRQPDGSVTRMTPEEREAKLNEARKYIDENCR